MAITKTIELEARVGKAEKDLQGVAKSVDNIDKKKRILLLLPHIIHSRYQNLIQFCVSCKRYCHKSCMNHVRTCSNRLGNRFTYTYDSTKQKVL